MSSAVDEINSDTQTDGTGRNAAHHQIPPLVPVTNDSRELWENYRDNIEAKAQKHFSIPVTFKMVPLKMSILDIEGTKTYFFKARIPNNRFVNVRIRLSGKVEPRDNQVAVESHASGGLDEEITKIF